MPIGTALVDRARLVTMEAATARVEGTTQLAPVYGEWFRCRLTLPGSQEGPDEPRGYRRSINRPSLLYGVRDRAGQTLAIRFNHKVVVESKEQGILSVWKVNGDPQPLRKKRSMIGWFAQLERLDEREFRELTL